MPKITVPASDLSFTGKAVHFNGLISYLMVLLIKEEMHCSNVQLLYEKGKNLTMRGLLMSAMSHVKLIAETRVYICHKNMKSMGIFFTVFRKFSRKNIQKIFYRK